MSKRRQMSRRESRGSFRRFADRVNSKNLYNPVRGGIRL